MKKETNSRTNGVDTDSVEEAHSTDDTIQGSPRDGYDADRPQVASGVAGKVHSGKVKYMC